MISQSILCTAGLSVIFKKSSQSVQGLGYGVDNTGFKSRQMQDFFFPKRSEWLCGPRSFFFHVYRRFFPKIKRPESDFDNSPPTSAEVKNEYSYISTLPIRLPGVDSTTLSQFLKKYSKRLEFIPIFHTKFLAATSQT